MSIFSNKWLILRTYFFTLGILFVMVFLCSFIYTTFPLKVQILPILANFCLGLAVFLGSYSLSRRTSFFSPKHIVLDSSAILLTIVVLSVLWGELSSSLLIQKAILIFACCTFGEILGKI